MEVSATAALGRSLIRTVVPIAIGFGSTWLAKAGIKNPEAIAGVGAAVSAFYYTEIRLLENVWPKAGLFLGALGAPVYKK